MPGECWYMRGIIDTTSLDFVTCKSMLPRTIIELDRTDVHCQLDSTPRPTRPRSVDPRVLFGMSMLACESPQTSEGPAELNWPRTRYQDVEVESDQVRLAGLYARDTAHAESLVALP
jgi:hypothetical protein